MAEVQVANNPYDTDPKDLQAIVAAIEASGFTAEPAEERPVLVASAVWGLVFHWLGDEAALSSFILQLVDIGKRISRHYRTAEKEPPRTIDLYGPDGKLLKSVEIEE
jgi:hypothetical protein